MRPRLLDLFCGAGGAAMGYHRAGFDVVGVDNRPQPRYPFAFIESDAMTFPLDGFDAIHASPPCQDHSSMRALHVLNETGWMLEATRERLEAQLAPWVIENVPGAPMRVDFKLCGCLFGAELRRERWFETSWRGFDLRSPCAHLGVDADFTNSSKSLWRRVYGQVTQVEDMRRVAGIDWMTRDELRQAIPPAYTEYIGVKLREQVGKFDPASAISCETPPRAG